MQTLFIKRHSGYACGWHLIRCWLSGAGQPCPVSSMPGRPQGNQLLLTSSSLWAIIFPVPCFALRTSTSAKRVLSAKQKIKQPKKKKKKLGISWLVAFIGHYFAPVEGFSDCLKRSEHGNSLTASFGSIAWANRGRRGLTGCPSIIHYQWFMPPFTQPTSNKYLLCAGAGLGAEHPTANNTHLTLW